MPALNEKWRLQVETRRSNGTGGYYVVFEDGSAVWGQRPARSDIDAAIDDIAEGVVVRRRRLLRLRWRDDLEAGNNLKEVRSDRMWGILTVAEVGRRRYVDCLLEAI